jgi:GST-like protein
MTITLYSAPMSSATPVEHALAELGVPYERVHVDLTKGEQRAPAFLALNPNGKVPTLVVHGTPMFEALAILTWLGETYGVERGLWPAAGTPERLQAMSWSTWAYVTCGAVLQRFNYAGSPRVTAELHSPAMRAHASDELQKLIGLLDAHLARRPWITGERFTLADVAVASMVTYGTYCGVSVEAHAHASAYLARFAAREAFAKVWGSPAR